MIAKMPLSTAVALLLMSASALAQPEQQPPEQADEPNPDEVRGLCALSCAYVVLIKERYPKLTVPQIAAALPGAYYGNVQIKHLVGLFESEGLSTRIVQGMRLEDLSHAKPYEGLYIMPLVSAGEDSPDFVINHIMLFLRKQDEETYLFMDTDTIVRHNAQTLPRQWEDGYAIVLSSNDQQAEAFIQQLQAKPTAGLLSPLIILGTFFLVLSLLIIIAYKTKPKSPRPARPHH